MKKGYLEISLLLLFVYFGWKIQLVMGRHAHHRRPLLSEDCSRCPPGYGVERRCNRHHDTECAACAPGHYSGHHSARRPCYPCSLCGLGLYVAHRCTASRDTVCDSCHTYRGPHNEDFYERCRKPLLHPAARNDSDPHHLPDKNRSPVAVDVSREIPPSVVVVSGLAIGVLAIALVVTCVVISSRWRCKRADQRYPYEAVATQEAVML